MAQKHIKLITINIQLIFFLFLVYTRSLCHISEVVSGTLIKSLEQRQAINTKRYKELLEEKERLLAKLN